MVSTAPATSRSWSVSSMRRTSAPVFCRAKSSANSTVRTPPMCSEPVGDGAKRTRTDMRGVYLLDTLVVMATRHERREQLKKDRRKKQHRKVSGKRVTPGWVAPAIIAGLLVLAILGLRQLGLFEPPPPAITPPPVALTEKIGTRVAPQPGTHVGGNQRVEYASLPPTSGSHWDLPHAGWGVKDNAQDDERVVHNLEHGGIVINYKGLS